MQSIKEVEQQRKFLKKILLWKKDLVGISSIRRKFSRIFLEEFLKKNSLYYLINIDN